MKLGAAGRAGVFSVALASPLACSLVTDLGALGSDAGDAGVTDASLDAEASAVDAPPPDAAEAGCNTDSDPHNCGACLHDCLGGACKGGMCQPITLAFSQSSPEGIVAGATNVYWASSGSGMIEVCASGGCGQVPSMFAFGQFGVSSLAIDSTNVYWTNYANPSHVYMCPLAGCNGSYWVEGTTSSWPGTVAVDAANVYWTVPGVSSLYSCAIGASCAAGTLVASDTTGSGIFGVAVDATYAYFTNATTGTVQRCALPTCGQSAVTLASGQGQPTNIVVDSARIYWTNAGSGQVMSCLLADDCKTPTVLADSQTDATGIAVDAENVYWTANGNGTVARCATTGCAKTPTVLATTQGGPLGIALDTTAVYWTNNGGGQAMKLAK